MPEKVRLPQNFINKLSELPETGMGYQKVNIKFKSGEVLVNRTVLNSEYLLLEEGENIDFKNIIKIDLE